jgi:hypothetical protein
MHFCETLNKVQLHDEVESSAFSPAEYYGRTVVEGSEKSLQETSKASKTDGVPRPEMDLKLVAIAVYC